LSRRWSHTWPFRYCVPPSFSASLITNLHRCFGSLETTLLGRWAPEPLDNPPGEIALRPAGACRSLPSSQTRLHTQALPRPGFRISSFPIIPSALVSALKLTIRYSSVSAAAAPRDPAIVCMPVGRGRVPIQLLPPPADLRSPSASSTPPKLLCRPRRAQPQTAQSPSSQQLPASYGPACINSAPAVHPLMPRPQSPPRPRALGPPIQHP
jgi:hypothetical protein